MASALRVCTRALPAARAAMRLPARHVSSSALRLDDAAGTETQGKSAAAAAAKAPTDASPGAQAFATAREVAETLAPYQGSFDEMPAGYEGDEEAALSAGLETPWHWSYAGLVEAPKVAGPAHGYLPTTVYSSKYFTATSQPAQHTERHDGRYYVMPELTTWLPEGLSGEWEQEFGYTGRSAVMVRQQGRQLVDALRAFEAQPAEQRAASNALLADAAAMRAADQATRETTPFRLVTGPRGIGKSGLLLYALHYARSAGWLTLYVPSGYTLTQQAQHYGPCPDPDRAGNLDQNDIAHEMLQHMLTLHAEQLGSLPQRQQYPRDRYLPAEQDEAVINEKVRIRTEERAQKARLKAQAESQGKMWDPATFSSGLPAYLAAADVDRAGASLADMVAWGIAHPAWAAVAVADLVQELRQVTEMPVLIAVDGMNWLYGHGKYFLNNQRVPVSKMTLPAAFRVLDNEGYSKDMTFARGFVLAADSLRNGVHMPYGMDGVLPRGSRLFVNPQTCAETHAQLLHYHYSGSFLELQSRATVNAASTEYFNVLSSGNPREVQRAALISFD